MGNGRSEWHFLKIADHLSVLGKVRENFLGSFFF